MTFLNANDNLVLATGDLLKQLHVKVCSSTIKKTLLDHPDYPSILSISDSLKKWNVDNVAIKADKNKLAELPLPFVAHLKKQEAVFQTITQVTDTHVIFNNASGGG